MAKLNLKTVNKKTKDQLITFVLVIAVYIVVQIMVAAVSVSVSIPQAYNSGRTPLRSSV